MNPFWLPEDESLGNQAVVADCINKQVIKRQDAYQGKQSKNCIICNLKNDFPRCSGKPGWNVKYRKGSRGICTLYPDKGFFTCLVSIGSKAADKAELILTACTPYVRKLYAEAPPYNGSRWLMIEVTDSDILQDVKSLIDVRINTK